MSSDLQNLMGLVSRGLLNVRYSSDGSLVMFKYSRKVFYDSLWGESPLLLRARGHVYDLKTGELVVNPFDKVFNYGENGTGQDTPSDLPVHYIRKVNGFMAAATWYKGDLLVTTTGTFDSDFVKLAEKYLKTPAMIDCFSSFPRNTFLFEICDPSDPHVIPEEQGAYFLGWRACEVGSAVNAGYSRAMCRHMPFRTTEIEKMTFSEALERGKKAEDEGGMIWNPYTGQFICKVKSARYLGLKLMGRSRKLFMEAKNKAQLRAWLDEEFYPLVDFVFDEYGLERYNQLSEQEKLDLLRSKL